MNLTINILDAHLFIEDQAQYDVAYCAGYCKHGNWSLFKRWFMLFMDIQEQ